MADYEDTILIATPEGVELELTLAGLASRATSELADTVIKVVIGLLALLLLAAGTAGLAIAYVIWFLLVFGYDVLFEVWRDGRSPGNAMSGIRVISEDGGPVTFQQSAIRTLLRLIDSVPGFYLVGAIAVARSRKNQRLGDMAAGTLVIRERFGDDANRLRRSSTAAGSPPAPAAEPAPGWNVSSVTPQEMLTIRQFLARRASLPADTRARLAAQIAAHLRTKVAGLPAGVGDEPLIEGVAAAKAERG